MVLHSLEFTVVATNDPQHHLHQVAVRVAPTTVRTFPGDEVIEEWYDIAEVLRAYTAETERGEPRLHQQREELATPVVMILEIQLTTSTT